MRNAGQPDGDGPQNLLDAFAVARSSEARARGVLVAAAGQVHASRWVTKTDSQAVDTFKSPGHGPVGQVEAGSVHFKGGPARRRSSPILSGQRVVDGPIAIVPSYGDADAALIDWHLGRGVRGLVVEGTGAGNVNATLVPGLEHARDRNVPVVITSRCTTGRVGPIYGGPGGGHSIASLGVIEGGDLSARKGRLALAVALAVGPGVDVRDWFASLLS
jgi:L-asparaginase